jgi:hypothetical protein
MKADIPATIPTSMVSAKAGLPAISAERSQPRTFAHTDQLRLFARLIFRAQRGQVQTGLGIRNLSISLSFT